MGRQGAWRCLFQGGSCFVFRCFLPFFENANVFLKIGLGRVWGVVSMVSQFILNALASGSGEYAGGNMGNLREAGRARRPFGIMGGSSMVIPLSQWCHVLSDKMWRG